MSALESRRVQKLNQFSKLQKKSRKFLEDSKTHLFPTAKGSLDHFLSPESQVPLEGKAEKRILKNEVLNL